MSSSSDDDEAQVSANEQEKEKEQLPSNNILNDIKFSCIVECLDFHPSKNFLASGTIDGDVYVHSYIKGEKTHELLLFDHHKRACRSVKFSVDGSFLFTGSKDKSIAGIDVISGKLVHREIRAHSAAIYSMLSIDEYLMASGDENGCVKIWDYRRQSAIMEFSDCEEYISDMATNQDKKILLATSGEGTLTAYNIRAKRLEMQSELMDSELQSVTAIKLGRKAVVGTTEGVLNIFNWGEWGNFSDRFSGHPESVDCIVPISENVVCTGSSDGLIRVVSIHPNCMVQTLGRHKDYPIEGLATSHDDIVASTSHDCCIKFWNVEDVEDPVEGMKKDERKKIFKEKRQKKNDSFFSDL